MALARLTPNGVGAALAGDTNLRPIVQVVNLRCVNVNGRGTPQSDRWRGLVSDGAETCLAMFAGQISDQACSGLVRRGFVVQLDEYVINLVDDRRY
ncbi:hypothetical protein ZWY2020_014932 [Hordeum vulgare]|nr:hypothetical protein ZWY2020_014932 [Hordeum vulgare]